MTYVLPPPPVTAVPVRGSADTLPVRNIYCVGRNYWAHRAEMGVTDRDPPFFFTKCRDAILHCPPGQVTEMSYPPETSDLHHEIELVVAIGKQGALISQADAISHVFGYAIGLDMTRRDLQGEAKKHGRPWDNGKSFWQSGPIGEIVPIGETGEITSGLIELRVNGEPRQSAPMDEMIWNVRETIEDLSRYHTLFPGDLIYTGTPAGVAAVVRGDLLEGSAEGVGALTVKLV